MVLSHRSIHSPSVGVPGRGISPSRCSLLIFSWSRCRAAVLVGACASTMRRLPVRGFGAISLRACHVPRLSCHSLPLPRGLRGGVLGVVVLFCSGIMPLPWSCYVAAGGHAIGHAIEVTIRHVWPKSCNHDDSAPEYAKGRKPLELLGFAAFVSGADDGNRTRVISLED